MMRLLKGKVYHELELTDKSCQISTSAKKRQRRDNSQSTKKGPSQLNGEASDSDSDSDSDASSLFGCSALIFVSSSHDTCSNEYLLSVPRCLSKYVFIAIVNKLEVAFSNYTITPTFSSSCSASTTFPRCRNLLEVHIDGMLCKQDEEKLSEINYSYWKEKIKADETWTLSQFRRKEIVDASENVTIHSHCKFNILATVTAVTPIIALDPSHPFALVELYDTDGSGNSAILVLKGPDALVCQSAIFPGDTLLFTNASRQPWRVPSRFKGNPAYMHLLDKIPSHVFVVSTTQCICWNDENLSSVSTRPYPEIPTSFSSLDGIISRVAAEEVSFKDRTSATIINWVDLELHQNSTDTVRLYLNHFPMSTTLQISLRVGTHIHAWNVHKYPTNPFLRRPAKCDEIPPSTFGAYLRSTICIVLVTEKSICHSNDDAARYARAPHNSGENLARNGSSVNQMEKDYIRIDNIVPYGLRNIRTSYQTTILMGRIKDWICNCYDDEKKDSQTNMIDTIAKFLKDNLDSTPRCNPDEKQTTQQRQSPRQKRQTKFRVRNPYAEFFDDCPDLSCPERSTEEFAGCCSSRVKVQAKHCPILVKLDDIRHLGIDEVKSRLKILVTDDNNQPRFAWSGVIHLDARTILSSKFQIEHQSNSTTKSFCIFTGGRVTDINQTSNNQPTAASNKCCNVPIHCHETISCNIGDIILGRVTKVIISCLCIAAPSTNGSTNIKATPIVSQESQDEQETSSLPSLSSLTSLTSGDDTKRGGQDGCVLLRIENYLFIASVQVQVADPLVIPIVSRKPIMVIDDDIQSITVHDAMNSIDVPSSSEKPRWVRGILLRSRFRPSSLSSSSNTYNCCTVSLSHINSNRQVVNTFDDVSFLQHVNIKVTSSHDTATSLIFRRSLSRIANGILLNDDNYILGCSWWMVADSGHSSLLMAGGIDEIFDTKQRCLGGIEILIPYKSLYTVNRGYIRGKCHLDDVIVKHLPVATTAAPAPEDNEKKKYTNNCFDFIGGGDKKNKKLDGMLCKFLQRRLIFEMEKNNNNNKPSRIVGETTNNNTKMCVDDDDAQNNNNDNNNDDIGIPTNTLCELIHLICQSIGLCNQSTTTSSNSKPTVVVKSPLLKPSMIRKISDAKFLGISFCQVQCICSMCYQPIVFHKHKQQEKQQHKQQKRRCQSMNDQNSKKHQTNKISDDDEPSFWHLPLAPSILHDQTILPITTVAAAANNGILTGTSTAAVDNNNNSILPSTNSWHCPNHCYQSSIEIKWECSGLLDDGTGQAKLYAERETALTLLAMTPEHVSMIEQGVLESDTGSIIFSKSIPVPYTLQQAVFHARQKCSSSRTRSNYPHRRQRVDTPLLALSTINRAEYLLQYHCRHSNLPRRKLSYYVRCKPIDDGLEHLNHTTIDQSFLGNDDDDDGMYYTTDANTYSLPPLKLQLVDCSIPDVH